MNKVKKYSIELWLLFNPIDVNGNNLTQESHRLNYFILVYSYSKCKEKKEKKERKKLGG